MNISGSNELDSTNKPSLRSNMAKSTKKLIPGRQPSSQKKPVPKKKSLVPIIAETPQLLPIGVSPSGEHLRGLLRAIIDQFVIPLDDRLTLLSSPETFPKEVPKYAIGNGKVSSRTHPLVLLARDRPKSYAKMITLIMSGADVPKAVMLVGVTRGQHNEWRRRGTIDQDNGDDTFFSRYVDDINFAALVPATQAEADVLRKNPLEWLRTGPGRWVSPEGTWQDGDVRKEQVPTPESTGLAEPNQLMEDDSAYELGAPTALDLPAALQVYKECGLGFVIEQAEAEAAKRQQDVSRVTEERTEPQSKAKSSKRDSTRNGSSTNGSH